jgi:invasion protein IalB
MTGMTTASSKSRYRRLAIALLAWTVASLPLGAARAADTAAEAPRITSQAFQSWTYRCEQPMTDGKPGASACMLAEDVIVNQDGKTVPVMTVVFIRNPKGKGYGMSFQVPLGIRLRQGLDVSADSGVTQPFSFDYCGPRACWADGAVGEALLRGLKHGKTGKAKVVLFNGRTAVIEFQLAGLPDGLAALDSKAQAAP